MAHLATWVLAPYYKEIEPHQKGFTYLRSVLKEKCRKDYEVLPSASNSGHKCHTLIAGVCTSLVFGFNLHREYPLRFCFEF